MIRKSWVADWSLAMVVCLASAGVAWAQDGSDPEIDDLDSRVTQFLEGVSSGATQPAYQELLRGSQLLTQTEALEALVEETNELSDRYGQYRAFEQVAAKRVGTDLVLLRYLYKCENFPVVWYFTFYRTPQTGIAAEMNDNWRVITVRFDTELELLGL